MDWYLDDGDVRLAHGDASTLLAELPAESVQVIVTSPPFWNLRDYGHPDQIGLEATPEAWCDRLVEVFRACRRVLRSDGVLWLEVGDTYNAYNGNRGPSKSLSSRSDPSRNHHASGLSAPALKPKDLVGAPWMLAFALRADGWYLRSDCLWARPNPMPESVSDRPTKAHSYVFLLSKTDRYFYDADAVREPHQPDGRRQTSIAPGETMAHENYVARRGAERWPGAGKNMRTVWNIPTEPTPFAHFATFPQKLVERCVKAGSSERGCCPECGASWRRVVEASGGTTGASWNDHKDELVLGQRTGHGQVVFSTYERREIGWRPTCSHYDDRYRELPEPRRRRKREQRRLTPDRWLRVRARPGEPAWPTRSSVVLDPFAGSGTTALVSRRLGRHSIGLELSEEYLEIAAERISQLSLFAE